jgi:hypothetical protein
LNRQEELDCAVVPYMSGLLKTAARPSQVEEVERRSRLRFAVRAKVQYRVLSARRSESGIGATLNISSKGLLFRSGLPAQMKLRLGTRLELTLEWPPLLDGVTPLKLVTVGRVIRCEGSTFAISIEHHEFRTNSKRRTSLPIDP